MTVWIIALAALILAGLGVYFIFFKQEPTGEEKLGEEKKDKKKK